MIKNRAYSHQSRISYIHSQRHTLTINQLSVLTTATHEL